MSVDPDSIEMRSVAESTDYTDYANEYAAANWQIGTSGSAVVRLEFDPLQERGGLRSNQYAELIYSEVYVGITADGDDTSNFNSVGAEMRGVLGADVDPADDATGTAPAFKGNNADFSFPTNNEPFDPDLDTKVDSSVLPNVFDFWRSVNATEHRSVMNYRNVFGRGPVLDADDTVNLYNTSVLTGGDLANGDNDVTALVRCVWDLAEGDDAREEFSLPHGD